MNTFERAVSRLYAYRSCINHYKNLKAKTGYLRPQGRLKTHPGKAEILAANANWLSKKDMPWFDYFYSLNGIASDTYMPPGPYYLTIEPTLNHRLMVSTLKDKNFYEQFFCEVSHPAVYARRINGFYYDADYKKVRDGVAVLSLVKSADAFILKASLDSGGGQSIYLFRKEPGGYKCDKTEFSEQFLGSFNHDFVIQELVKQHQFYRQFNPSSNNTLRLLVYRSVADDSLNILHTLLRIGAKGSYLDHDNQGGVSVYLNEDGKLLNTSYDGKGNPSDMQNGVKFSTCGPAPGYREARETAIGIASRCYYGRLLALDFTVDEEGRVLLLDINCWRNGISHYQMHCGTLFGNYTQEIVDYCWESPGFNIIRILSRV